ncbi:MAG: hypothetical protein JNJ61_25615 [Anaerolineae bacterium]|nr:hypothetical protein [Anaerolineae bacterium]
MGTPQTADYILYDAFVDEIGAVSTYLGRLRDHLADALARQPYPLPDVSSNLTIIVGTALILAGRNASSWGQPRWQAYLETYLSRRAQTPLQTGRRHAGERALGNLSTEAAAAFAALGALADERLPRKYVRKGERYNRKLIVAIALCYARELLS